MYKTLYRYNIYINYNIDTTSHNRLSFIMKLIFSFPLKRVKSVMNLREFSNSFGAKTGFETFQNAVPQGYSGEALKCKRLSSGYINCLASCDFRFSFYV